MTTGNTLATHSYNTRTATLLAAGSTKEYQKNRLQRITTYLYRSKAGNYFALHDAHEHRPPGSASSTRAAKRASAAGTPASCTISCPTNSSAAKRLSPSRMTIPAVFPQTGTTRSPRKKSTP